MITVGLGATIALSSGGGGAIGGSGATISESASISVRAARTSQQKKTRTEARLRARLPRSNVQARADSSSSDCAGVAYGQVREYLLRHPCRSVQRATMAVSPGGRDRAVVAVAWVEMRNEDEAAGLKRLVDAPGTGSVRPLDRRIELTGERYASSIDGPVVTTAEVEPDGGSPAGRVLEEIAQEAAN